MTVVQFACPGKLFTNHARAGLFPKFPRAADHTTASCSFADIVSHVAAACTAGL